MGVYSSANRSFTATITYTDTTSTTRTLEDEVGSFTLTESVSSDNRLTMGTVNSATLELELIGLSAERKAEIYKDLPITLKITCESDGGTDSNRLLGIYYIDSIEWSKFNDTRYSAKITAYDRMCKLEKNFTNPSSSSVTVRDIVAQISTLTTTLYTASEWDDTITYSSLPSDMTCRQMLGYCAGLQGSYAYIGYTTSGYPKLTNGWYGTTEKEILADDIYQGGLTIDTTSNTDDNIIMTLKYIESGTSDTPIVYPNNGNIGNTVSFENPMMTSAVAQSIFEDRIGDEDTETYYMTYSPMKVKWRGDLTNSIGDKLKIYTDDTNYIISYMSDRVITYDGSLVEEYSCVKQNETSISFNGKFSMNKIQRKLSVMETAITDATTNINNVSKAQSGVFTITKNATTGASTGWTIDSSTNSNKIIANIGGIGFSTNGGQSMDAAAMYFDSDGNGVINADLINVGTMSAAHVSFSASEDYTTLNNYINSKISGSSPAISIGNGTISGVSLSDIITELKEGEGRVFSCTADSSNYLKTCTLQDTDAFELEDGLIITVDFSFDGYYASSTNIRLYLLNRDGTAISSTFFPVYYNGDPLPMNATTNWRAGERASFTYNASLQRFNMNEQAGISYLSDFCYSANRTFIDGGHIYAGTIDAKSIYAGKIAKRTQYSETTDSNCYTYFDLDYDELGISTGTSSQGGMKASLHSYSQYGTLIHQTGLYFLSADAVWNRTTASSHPTIYGKIDFSKITSGSSTYYAGHLYSQENWLMHSSNGIEIIANESRTEPTEYSSLYHDGKIRLESNGILIDSQLLYDHGSSFSGGTSDIMLTGTTLNKTYQIDLGFGYGGQNKRPRLHFIHESSEGSLWMDSSGYPNWNGGYVLCTGTNPSGDVTITGNLTATGNLTINGSTRLHSATVYDITFKTTNFEKDLEIRTDGRLYFDGHKIAYSDD